MTARTGLAAVLVLVWAATAHADLSVRNIQAALGPLGPERKSADYFPHDEVFYRYTITGLVTDKQGDIDVLIESRIIDANGKVIPGSRDPVKGKLHLAGGTFSGSSVVRLGNNFTPGEYTLTVTVTDNLAAESVQFSRKFRVKPATFAIVAPRFYYGDTALPAPAGGYVGQLLRVRLKVIGFDKGQGKIDSELAVQLLDAEGKELLEQPKRGTLTSDDPTEVKNATHLNFTEVIGLNRAGNFTLRLTLTDKIGKQTATLDLPLTVREP
jgi:hypothetical protein